jgi:hypothetical protein
MRAQACLALLALSLSRAAGGELPSCWRATHSWPLSSAAGATDYAGGLVSTVVGTPLPEGSTNGGAPSGLSSLLFGSTCVFIVL